MNYIIDLLFWWGVFVIFSIFLILIYNINLSFLKFNVLKSPKEKYEDMLIERFKAGDWKLWEWDFPDLYVSWVIVWFIGSDGDVFALRGDIKKYQRVREFISPLFKKKVQDGREERKRNEEIQKQKEEDELYESKIKELLKIKPLDADLKEYFKRASRRIELSNNMLKRAEENKKDYEELLTITPESSLSDKWERF